MIVVHILVQGAGDGLVDIAAAAVAPDNGPQAKLVLDQRQIQGDGAVIERIAAIHVGGIHLDMAFKLGQIRCGRNDTDGAAHRAGAKQCFQPQHFDMVDVMQLDIGLSIAHQADPTQDRRFVQIKTGRGSDRRFNLPGC